MKKSLLLISLLMLNRAITVAQVNSELNLDNCTQKALQEAGRISNKLKLDSNQSDSVSLFLRNYYQGVALRRNQQLPINERKLQIQLLEQTFENSLLSVLGPAQTVQYLEEKGAFRRKLDSLQSIRKNQQLINNN